MVTALSLVSCNDENEIINQDAGSNLRFSWWGKDDRNECTLAGIKQFEKKFNNISVKPEYSDFDGFKTRMDVEFYSNTEADVMQLDYGWLDEYSKHSDALYDLNKLSDYIDIDDFSDEVLSYGKCGDKLYGIPVSLDAITFYYNKTLFDSYGLELPETWEDLFKAADVMKTDEVYPIILTNLSSWICCTAYTEQLTGKPMYNSDGDFQYTSDDLKIMFDFYISLIKQKVTKRPSEFNRRDFQNGVSGGIAVWLSDAKYYYTPAQDEGYSIQTGDYLTMDSMMSYGWYYKPSAFYSIKESTDTPEDAAKLVNYLLNSEEMTINQGTDRGVPLSSAALETLEARDMLKGISVNANKKITENKNMKLMNPMIENQDIADYFNLLCDNIYFDKTSPEQASINLYNKILDSFS